MTRPPPVAAVVGALTVASLIASDPATSPWSSDDISVWPLPA